jgi:hypothetical protein
MPSSYQIDVIQQLVRTRAWGELTNENLRDHYHRLAVDPRFRPTFRQLTNLDEVITFAIKHWMIAEAASWPVFDVGTRRAVVAASDVAFGLARMFSLNAERVGQNVRVFRLEGEAEEWLDSPAQPGREPDIAPRPSRIQLGAA